MVFVREVVPEESRQTFDFRIFKDLLGRPFQFPPWEEPEWTIDREHNTLLVELGADFDRDRKLRYVKFGLFENGPVAYFFGEEVATASERGTVLTWNNVVLEIPTLNLKKQEKTISTIKHAVRAHGLHDEVERVIAVHINLSIIIEGTCAKAWRMNPYAQTSWHNQNCRHAQR